MCWSRCAEITADRDRNWEALSVKEIWVSVGLTRREGGRQARETRGQWPFKPAQTHFGHLWDQWVMDISFEVYI